MLASPVNFSPGYPDVMGLEPTSTCNLRCAMCSLPARRPASTWSPGAISPEILERALEPAARVGVICANGWGENFVDPGFLDRLEEMDRRGIVTIFSTNGTLVTATHAARLARLQHLFSVNVSLDSADPVVYRQIRRHDQADAIRGLAALAAEPALLPKLTVSAVVWERSLGGLAGLPEVLSRYRVSTLILQGRVPALEPGALRPEPSGLVPEIVDALREGCHRHGIRVHIVPYLSWEMRGDLPAIWRDRASTLLADEAAADLPRTRQCGSPWEFPVIDKDGRVFPCCISPDCGEAAMVGDLRTSTFDEIWWGEPLARVRRGLLTGDPPEPCRSCPVTSTGPHFFALYAARLLDGRVPCGPQEARVRVRNVGATTWTHRTRLRIGTTRRRDRSSALATRSWLSDSRVGTFLEETVPPGCDATFAMDVPPETALDGECFQLLVEDVCWLPGTEFGLARRDRTVDVIPLPRGRPLRDG